MEDDTLLVYYDYKNGRMHIPSESIVITYDPNRIFNDDYIRQMRIHQQREEERLQRQANKRRVPMIGKKAR